jgi:signal transduction histidine kinase
MVSDAVAYFLTTPMSEGHQEMVGKRLEEIFAPETALGAAVLEAFADDGQVSAQGVTLEDGRQVQISLDRIDDGLGGGGNMGTLLTLRDMESVAQLGQELEVARRLAAIGKLTAGVGHEVKNPINAMVVHLELLRGKLVAGGREAFGGAQRHVDILSGEMQRLDRVVQTLADFSRPMELHLREHDLRQVVEVVVDLTAAEMEEHGVVVRVEAPHETMTVRADAELMQQALLNLLLNGMQAMRAGGEIRIRMQRDHQFAVVEVIDEGEGIPVDLLPRIFELYFTTKPKGSGIGLAMTYRILQLHGGAMDVRSNADPSSPERGTVFTFRLPIATGVGVEGRKVVAAGPLIKG